MNIDEIGKELSLNLSKNNNPKDILFFTGTGISNADPCAFPLGNELHKILLKYYTDMTELEINDFLKNDDVAFEKTVSTILNSYGQLDEQNLPFHLLSDIFIYRDNDHFKQENDYHKFFRDHIQKGGKHFTVNLDQFIELDDSVRIDFFTSSQINDNSSNHNGNGFLYKIHGDPLDIIGLQGFLIEVIKNGFSTSIQNFFDTQINQVKTVIFVGYGGVDKYDITPYFKKKSNCFFNKTSALWINYCKSNQIVISENLSIAQQTILSKFNSWLAVDSSPELILNKLFKDGPKIQNADRANGYKKEYEDFFRVNSEREIFYKSNNLSEEQINELTKIHQERRSSIRKQLID